MKTNLSILIIGSMLTLSCTTINMTYTSPNSNDDLYYSKADAQRDAIYNEEVKVQDMSKANSTGYAEDPQVQNRNAVDNDAIYRGTTDNANNTDATNRVATENPNYSNGNADQSYTSDGKTIINNYYGDDYDDDEMGYYSTRINRFHRSYVGFNYYSPAFCGVYYDPFFSPGWNFGIGFGYSYGYYDPFFNPFYNPWYSPFSPYYGFGGWGGYGNYDAYRWGYNNGYWDGRNDNGYYGGGYYNGGNRGGSKNTIVRGPRPNRGGTVSSAGGNRVAPERGGMPAAGSGSESIRSVPPTRNPINTGNSNNTTNTTNDIRTAPTRDPIPVRNNTGNGYVPPRLPSATQSESNPSSGSNNTTPRSETIIRNNNSNPQPVRINPNYGGQSIPNIRNSESSKIRSSEAPRRSETPRVSAPSRSSAPSSSPAPSRSSGGNSAPASRPRPR